MEHVLVIPQRRPNPPLAVGGHVEDIQGQQTLQLAQRSLIGGLPLMMDPHLIVRPNIQHSFPL